MTSTGRRDFIRMAASGAAAVGAGMLPPGIARALTLPAARRTGTLMDVDHIVILTQENRSFDHYFGTLRGVRGFGDPRPAPLPGGQSVFNQPYNGGTVLPFRPDLPALGLQFLNGTPHDWNSSHAAWNAGRNDQWVPNKGVNTMAYLTRSDIPYHYALADAFTVCDAYHCSVMGPTDPNRYHLWTGWLGNDGSGGGPVIGNDELGYGWSTYPERLSRAGVRWKVYQDVGVGLDATGYWGWTANPYIGNYGDNSLLYFFQYQNALPGSPLYEGARRGTNVAANGPQTLFDQLRADVIANRLPQVSWIAAPEAYSEHSIWPSNWGARYIDQVLLALTANPEVWGRTALFVMYDENDGYFDHVAAPFPAPSRSAGLSTVDATNEIYAGSASHPSGPYGLGARVPMTVVSPWSKGGWVCSQVFDHTSLIRFVEARFGGQYPGLVESNITPWRRAVCGDMTAAFDFTKYDDDLPALPSTAAYAADGLSHTGITPQPPAQGALPRQESGVRRSRALPYALAVDATLDNARRNLWLNFANRGSAGAVFLVYQPGTPAAPRSYTVEAGKSLADAWTTVPAGGRYDLLVHGPNGWMRHYTGDAAAAAAATSLWPEVECLERVEGQAQLRLVLRNLGTTSLRFTVTPNAYLHEAARHHDLAPGASLTTVWSLAASQGWYDLSVTVDRSPAFLRRLAGRVETGRPSISDPAIGAN
ncbi:MAG: phospholipase C, phosphocholine-specific [Burkholderiales bacterium]|nr:phospholipase C, phosphocholine-specific [Burkholderiales bacterium]